MVEDDGFIRLDRSEIEQHRKEYDKKTGTNRIDDITTIENFKSNSSFEDLKKQIFELQQSKTYKMEMVRGTLSSKRNIRRTYLNLIQITPARIGELKEFVLGTRRTIYDNLYKLVELGLVSQISVAALFERKRGKKTEDERLVLTKFNKWTQGMDKKTRQRFLSVTNYFVLTEDGKNGDTISWAIRKEKECKGLELGADYD